MKLGKVVGKVWATEKDSQLDGVKLYVMQPINDSLEPVGNPIIVADTVNSGPNDIVFWVSGREATFGFPDKKIPSDATIVGIVDEAHAASKKLIEKRRKEWVEKNLK